MFNKLLSSLHNKKRPIEEFPHFFADEVEDLMMINIPQKTLGEQIPLNGLRTPTGLEFIELYSGPRGDSLIGLNKFSGILLKVGLYQHPRKVLDIEGEIQVIHNLNQQGCTSCPRIIESGYVDIATLGIKQVSSELPKTAPYMIQEFIPTANRMPLPDLLLAMIEQKNLGYYHGDVKPANIRFDPTKGVCVLIDYDQAIKLDRQTTQLNAFDFLHWCDLAEQKKHNLPTWRRHFSNLKKHHIDDCLYDGALDLSKTTIFRNQVTTNTTNGIYQSIREKDIFVNGIRDLHDRIEILNSIEFTTGERVLDIGCNAGLLCHYLHDRGCDVTGVDLDPYMVAAAGIISRITDRNIKFTCFDLGNDTIPRYFDTILLFSILHHASNVKESAKKVASSCNRVIIECRPVESGKRPNNGTWRNTSRWDYGDVDGLLHSLESLFPNFSLVKNHGIGGKNRYILEFVKQTD